MPTERERHSDQFNDMTYPRVKCVGSSFVREDGQKVIDEETGEFKRRPCGNYAIKGGRVCRMHGGAAPQVKAAAEERIKAMSGLALDRVQDIIEKAEDDATALKAAMTILDRAGYKAIEKQEIKIEKAEDSVVQAQLDALESKLRRQREEEGADEE